MAGLLLILLSFVACAHNPTVPDDVPSASVMPLDAASDEVIDLRVGASAAVPGTSSTVTFVRVISDARCPKGVQCIWEGDAVVELRVQPTAGDAKTITLHTSDRFEQQASAGGVSVRLERLQPYPEREQPIAADSYVVTLRVSAG
jgi:hypothetical protein